jgi:hypothetical protein
MIWPAPNEVKITEPSVSISRSIRWPEPGRPASSVKAGLRPPPAAAAALTELAARPLLATMESTTMSGARNDCNSTFTEASYTKYLTFPMLKAKSKAAGHRITAGEDKAYDTADHVANLRTINVTPHVTQNQAITKTGKTRNSAIDERTTRHPGYGMSQSRRPMIECIFGWGKQHGTMRKTKHRGIAGVAADFMLNLIAYNLIRIPKLVVT